jgi:branched-chain amino acid aminotransferase
MVGPCMENEIAIWCLAPGNEQDVVEKITLRPFPSTLDEATQRLPGGGYTTLRTFGRFRILRLEDHFTRLEDTARLAGVPVHLDRAGLLDALRHALGTYPQEDMRVRIILDLEMQPGTLYLLVDALHTPEPEDYLKGVKVITRRLQRENPKAKLTRFIDTAAAVRQTLPAGMNEAVMVGADGRLLEGLSSNFFAVKSGVVWTAEKGVLSGITRSLVLDVARELGIPLEMEGLNVEELDALEEAFITSASRAVLPVTEIDGKLVGTGVPGPVTRRILQGYQERLERELDVIE